MISRRCIPRDPGLVTAGPNCEDTLSRGIQRSVALLKALRRLVAVVESAFECNDVKPHFLMEKLDQSYFGFEAGTVAVRLFRLVVRSERRRSILLTVANLRKRYLLDQCS